MKIINPERVEFKDATKIKINKMPWASPFCRNFSATSQNASQEFVWPQVTTSEHAANETTGAVLGSGPGHH